LLIVVLCWTIMNLFTPHAFHSPPKKAVLKFCWHTNNKNENRIAVFSLFSVPKLWVMASRQRKFHGHFLAASHSKDLMFVDLPAT
jgi:hypothetical protein